MPDTFNVPVWGDYYIRILDDMMVCSYYSSFMS